MMKIFEIRDSGTFIPAIAFKLSPGCDTERWLLARAGFGRNEDEQNNYIFLCRATNPTQCEYDIYNWGNQTKTMQVAHDYIIKNWDQILGGDVIDVEFILKEKDKKKISEKHQCIT